VTRRFAYDRTFDPPAPVLLVRMAPPDGSLGVMVPMLLDTGADCTLVPTAVARALELPRVGSLEVVGLGGSGQRADEHAALVEVGGQRFLATVVPLGQEAILGRDVLNLATVVLDGPKRRFEVRRTK